MTNISQLSFWVLSSILNIICPPTTILVSYYSEGILFGKTKFLQCFIYTDGIQCAALLLPPGNLKENWCDRSHIPSDRLDWGFIPGWHFPGTRWKYNCCWDEMPDYSISLLSRLILYFQPCLSKENLQYINFPSKCCAWACRWHQDKYKSCQPFDKG